MIVLVEIALSLFICNTHKEPRIHTDTPEDRKNEAIGRFYRQIPVPWLVLHSIWLSTDPGLADLGSVCSLAKAETTAKDYIFVVFSGSYKSPV